MIHFKAGTVVCLFSSYGEIDLFANNKKTCVPCCTFVTIIDYGFSFFAQVLIKNGIWFVSKKYINDTIYIG